MFNEEANIGPAVASALRALAAASPCYEVIVVDDGSRDRTGAIAERLAAEDPRVRVVRHPRNRGYGAALRSGFEAARHPVVAFVDGDNQFDLGELPLLLGAIDGFDVVSGRRTARNDPWHRRTYGYLYNRLARALFDVPIGDVNCGFKIYRRDLIQQVLPTLRSTGALINVEMLARARQLGARVAEVGVRHYPRTAGQQTGGSPAVVLRAVLELLGLWRELRRRQRPPRRRLQP